MGTRVGSLVATIAVAVLAACGGGGGGGGGGTDPGGNGGGGNPGGNPPPAAGLLRAAEPGDVVAYFKAKVAERAAQGMDGTAPLPAGGNGGPVFSASPPGSISGTTVQERGVDEDDRLKAEGAMLYALHPTRYESNGSGPATTFPGRLAAARIGSDGNLQDVGSLDLPADTATSGMYVAAGRIVTIGNKNAVGGIQPAAILPAFSGTVALDVFGAADGAKPTQQHRIELDGWLVGTRRIGNTLYVVSTWQPDLGKYRVPANSTAAQAQAALADLTAAQLMPQVRIDGAAPQPLVAETDCFLQPANASLGLQLTVMTAFDLTTGGTTRSSRCFVGDGNTLYMSPQNVYIASSQQVWIAAAFSATVFPRDVQTDIHKFALEGMNISYRGSGQVTGHLGWDTEKMPYRMSEHQGDLRVVTFTGETGWTGAPVPFSGSTPAKSPSPATLTVLRENTGKRSLETIATLPNADRPGPIGKAGEQVYAVHFAGPRAYVVTFRRIDPLYVLDLSSPADPKVAGELTMPGYSDYLYPIAGGDWLLGVGRDASATGVVAGLKLALFDVRNPAAPRLASSVSLGEAGSFSALDASRHGINLFAHPNGKMRIALPVRLMEPGGRTSVQGLARFEADPAAGTLVERPFTVATRFDTFGADAAKYSRYDLGAERSLQGTLATYYLSGGGMTTIRE